jgi:protoheme IX farnesyltransferase
MLVKLNLSLTVVFTSVFGYLILAKGNVNIPALVFLILGGFFTTGSANAINEVLEKDNDALMKRTQIRPLAAGRMKMSEAVLFAGISCLIGISFLAMISPITSILGMISFLLYAFVYTPLKRYSTIAVGVGAIPGALPVLIGGTAVDGQIQMLSIALFIIQFLWQFPHFWSIGYLGFDDYKNAGYKLLPETDGSIDRMLGKNSMLYIALILPVFSFLYFSEVISILPFILCIMVTMIFVYYGYKFHKNFDRISARKLMFASFFYMPLILLFILLN